MPKDWDSMISSLCFMLCGLYPDRVRTVPRADKPDVQLLTQFVIIPERLYLQHFHNAETIKKFHNHRWGYMRSFVLSGSYMEERTDIGFATRRRFKTHTMNHEVRHRVHKWGKDCWSLFYMGEVVNPDWGYFDRATEEFIPWHEFITDENKLPHVETGKITRY